MTATLPNYRAAIAHLQRDPLFAQVIAEVGPCTLLPDKQLTPLQALVRSVCYQQLHTKAGDRIYARVLALLGEQYTAQILLATAAEDLRAAGLSARKVDTLQGLAQAERDGILPQREQAAQLTEAELIDCITRVKGIGPWTVQMWLMFYEGRLDIWPVLDFGVREGWKRLYHLDQAPTAKQLQPLADHLRPYRSIAAWYLWRVPKK